MNTHISELIRGNAVIGQSGGPTAVINQSLVGVIEGLRCGLHAAGFVQRIFGMKHGVRGLTKDNGDLYDFTHVHQDRLNRLAATPSACLGSTRDKPDTAYCERILAACKRHDIRYFFYIGGNDSSDTCRIVQEMAMHSKYDMRCFHVPKTVDNDLVENDHCPGYPSAARYVALAFMADAMDNASLPGIKINVVMGRNAGFLTAAAALARRQDKVDGGIGAPPVRPASLSRHLPHERDAPHLIYVPEVSFDIDRFIADVDSVYSKLGRCHVAVSEGIRNNQGQEIGATLIKEAQRDAHGNVQLSGSGALGDSLADLVKTKLTPTGGKPPRVRADTFGYLQRCWPYKSPVDEQEARLCGRYAAQVAMAGRQSGSITINRIGTGHHGEPYASEHNCVELSAIAAKTRTMPASYLEGHNNVSQAFVEYCRPLVGDLPLFEQL